MTCQGYLEGDNYFRGQGDTALLLAGLLVLATMTAMPLHSVWSLAHSALREVTTVLQLPH